jgi:hypothetical protein
MITVTDESNIVAFRSYVAVSTLEGFLAPQTSAALQNDTTPVPVKATLTPPVVPSATHYTAYGNRIFTSPLAKSIAKEAGVNVV